MWEMKTITLETGAIMGEMGAIMRETAATLRRVGAIMRGFGKKWVAVYLVALVIL
jgi:hypothetical protein